MPLSIAQVAQQKQAKLFRRGVDWSFSIDGDHWHWRSADKQFEKLPILIFLSQRRYGNGSNTLLIENR